MLRAAFRQPAARVLSKPAIVAAGTSRASRCQRKAPCEADALLVGLAAGTGACLLGVGFLAGRTRGGSAGSDVTRADLRRLQRLLHDGRLLHPLGGVEGERASFADLAHGLSLCCGLAPARGVREAEARKLAAEIGGVERRHIIVVLCDGMGCNILEDHLDRGSFLRRNNRAERLLAVFPSTTPAALTTLATGVWPGQHGQPGWDLRDQKGCDYPGKPASGPVQLRVLNNFVADMRSHRPAKEFGFEDKDIYVAPPWTIQGYSKRHMLFVSAYNGGDFTNWYEGPHNGNVKSIPETVADTLGTPEGAAAAVEFFQRGVDHAIAGVEEAEKHGWKSYIYVYTAHPDKHMHALGTTHPEVRSVVRGLNTELERLWKSLEARGRDAALVVTADHGHITVKPSDMVTLPDEIIECLEYANVGVHGKGRHACLHCRSGRHRDFEDRWAKCRRLRDNFLLLTVEDAAAEGLFGPDAPLPEIRPRLGDYLAISVNACTLLSPDEAAKYRDGCSARCQGAHGSLLREELQIPFVVCTPEG